MTKLNKEINIRVADPAGNITVFVLAHFERSEYTEIASRLLAMDDIGAEQVAFVTGSNSMEMCGLEFCGNASRAFALMAAEADQSYIGPGQVIIQVKVSGADGVVEVEVDTSTGNASIAMPAYKSARSLGDLYGYASRQIMERISETELETLAAGTVVDLGGIVHVVLEDTEASDELFEIIRDLIQDVLDPPASGVMFMKGSHMAPIVYVKDVDTIYHEGSCCSGTTAAVIARTYEKPDGSYEYEIVQPAGSLTGSASSEGGVVKNVRISGPVELGPVRTVTI